MAPYRLKLPNCSVVTTEVGDEETFIDFGTRISKEHGLQGHLTLNAGPGEANDVKKYQGSQRVRAVFPAEQTLFHIGVIPDKKPAKAEAPAATKAHNLFIRENSAEDDAEQDNVILYPGSPVGRAAVNITAGIHGNRASGKSKQNNHVGGPIRGAIQRQ